MNRPPSQLAERLLADHRITADQYEGILHHVRRLGVAQEEAIIETQALAEADLLKYLARLYGTRFVTTDKLARADIDPQTLAMVPRKLAERLQICPVVFDASTGSLSIVCGDAGDPDTAKSVQLATNIAKVRVYVARPAAVKAAIGKYYGGDIHAFSTLDRGNLEQFHTLMNVYEKKLVTEESIAASMSANERRGERVLNPRDIERAGQQKTVQRTSMMPPPSGTTLPYEQFVESLTVLVSLLENNRGELRGHSAHVARLIRKAGERIGVSVYEINALACAALLHDIGKTGTYHLTALNVAEYENHRVVAQKSYLSPLRMFETVQLGPTVEQTLGAMYERFDGSGFPDGVSGKDIPLGARLLAIADTYADLTLNGRNPFRKQLSATEACDVIGHYKGTVFDGNLIDMFKTLVLGEDMKSKLLSDRPVVLIVDADPEESTVLELRLMEQGYDVRVARTPEAALKVLATGTVGLCISEIEFPTMSGLDLLLAVRGQPGGHELPWIVYTRDGRREVASRALELGAADYCVKPVPTDVLLVKVRNLLEKAARPSRGVSGSLAEMALGDVVSVLAQGRKTGTLRIRSGPDAGEVHFDQGGVVNAMFGRYRGEEAFYAMGGLSSGEFAFDPQARPSGRVIGATVDALLHESARRRNEAATRPGSDPNVGFGGY